MRKIKKIHDQLILLFPLLLGSCNLPVFAVTKPSAEATTPLQTPIVQLPPAVAATIGVPSVTATISPTAASVPPLPAGERNPVKFGVNGTYVDIPDSIPSGSSKTYTINALQGQIMSISVLPTLEAGQWGYVSIELKGADGTQLCPVEANSECTYWRGVLPAAQDYRLTLTPMGDTTNFTLRVAINPPGKSTQDFRYFNAVSKYSLTYPDYFAPGQAPQGNYKSTPELALQFIDSMTIDKTNLREAYILVSSTSNPQIVATCTQPDSRGPGPEQVDGNEVINGYSFVHSESSGAGAGNLYEQNIYRTALNGFCFEVIYFIHYTNIGNYEPGTIVEFDRNDLFQKFSQVLSTFSVQ